MTNIAGTVQDARLGMSNRFIRGTGLEIGALDAPFPVLSAVAEVRYVDRMRKPDLLIQYPELLPRADQIVDPDIVDDGETLMSIPSNTQDFIIISHFLEHTENPIGTLRTHLDRLRPGGTLVIAIPNSAHPESWDNGRELTSFSHLVKDDTEGPAWSRATHFREWVQFAGKRTDPAEIDAEARRLMEMNYSIHFHCWTSETFKIFLVQALDYLKQSADIVHLAESEYEMTAVIRKRDQGTP